VPIDHDGSQIADLMRKYHIELLTLAADDADTTLGIDAAFDLEMESAQQALDDRAKLIRSVAETTKEDVRRLTGQAAKEGWSIAELAQRIRDQGEIASQTRAELISRTETAAMYSKGSLIAYAASGQVSGTEWLLGPEPCDICQPLGGTVAALGKSFAEGIDSPPAHPRCTCALAPVLTEA
jgi:SPP1 gp7 family putative phage head morphogenesis protein